MKIRQYWPSLFDVSDDVTRMITEYLPITDCLRQCCVCTHGLHIFGSDYVMYIHVCKFTYLPIWAVNLITQRYKRWRIFVCIFLRRLYRIATRLFGLEAHEVYGHRVLDWKGRPYTLPLWLYSLWAVKLASYGDEPMTEYNQSMPGHLDWLGMPQNVLLSGELEETLLFVANLDSPYWPVKDLSSSPMPLGIRVAQEKAGLGLFCMKLGGVANFPHQDIPGGEIRFIRRPSIDSQILGGISSLLLWIGITDKKRLSYLDNPDISSPLIVNQHRNEFCPVAPYFPEVIGGNTNDLYDITSPSEPGMPSSSPMNTENILLNESIYENIDKWRRHFCLRAEPLPISVRSHEYTDIWVDPTFKSKFILYMMKREIPMWGENSRFPNYCRKCFWRINWSLIAQAHIPFCSCCSKTYINGYLCNSFHQHPGNEEPYYESPQLV